MEWRLPCPPCANAREARKPLCPLQVRASRRLWHTRQIPSPPSAPETIGRLRPIHAREPAAPCPGKAHIRQQADNLRKKPPTFHSKRRAACSCQTILPQPSRVGALPCAATRFFRCSAKKRRRKNRRRNGNQPISARPLKRAPSSIERTAVVMSPLTTACSLRWHLSLRTLPSTWP